MARCPKCLILEGTEGARLCQIVGCPQVFSELDQRAVHAAVRGGKEKPGPKPKRASYSEFLEENTAASESHNQSGILQPVSQPDVVSARPRGRPRKSTASVTVYDRDARIGELPTNLMRPQGTD
jgi:hypothetical protein